jgi:predicted DNA binding CopG/RHH family protein
MGRGGKRKGAGAPTKDVKRDTAITIRVTQELRDRIKEQARSRNMSITQLIIESLERYFDSDI